jgi:ankyrin repeat protein
MDDKCLDNCQTFIGREWVFAKIDKTLDIRNQVCINSSVTAIFGCAGSGKTFLIKHMTQIQRFKDKLLAVFDCDEKTQTNHFIACIETQIKDKLNIENCINNQNDDEIITSDDIFRNSILFPLLEAKNVSAEQRYIIVIDSIDTNGDICHLIANHIHLLPKWLHLIISARPKRRRAFTKMFSGSRKIVIDDMRKLNVINDMKFYIMQRIKQMNCTPLGTIGRKALNQIGIKSNGCFLYVKLILDCFERGLMRTEEVDSIGATLNGLYLALCGKLFDSNPDSEIDYKLIISITIASKECKITKEALQKCLRWDNNYLDSKLDDLCSYSILQINSEDMIELSHTSLIEWITDVKHCTRRFLCDKSFGHIMLALCDSLPSVNDYHFHISNSNIDNYHIHHYALWLLLTIDSSFDIELLSKLVDDSPIVNFIQKCKNSIQENKSSSDYFPIDSSGSPLITRNLSLQKSKDNNYYSGKYNSKCEMSENDSEYIELMSQFKRALLKCDIPTVRDILTNDSLDILNQHIIKQKTPLFWAIKSGNSSIVELLLEFDADVNVVCDIETGLTPLMVAVCQNSIEICELLLDSDADVDACDTLSRSPLVHAIVQHSSPKIIELLLFWGAHTDYMDHLGRSLLCLAANESQCSVETVRLLLAVGCDELHKDNNGRTPLHLAALNGNADVVEALLDIGGDTLQHARDNEGKLALHDSAIGGFVNACQLLISNESINVLSHDGKSALRLAALNSHLDVVTLLVENGANINYIDADGRTTVYCVACGAANDLNIVNTLQHLVKLGADLEIKDLEGRTALHVSAWQGMVSVVEALIELGANIDAVDNEGRTPVMMAAWNGHAEVVSILVEAGCDVNHVSSSQGATPLLIAAQQGHIDACSVLLSAGSDASHVDFYGRNAQDVANNCGHRDIVILLDSRVINSGEHCPTLSSHASTAETAAIGEIEALFDSPKTRFDSRDSLHNKKDNSRQHKKMMSISKLTKLLH